MTVTPNPVLKKLGLADNDHIAIIHTDAIGMCQASVETMPAIEPRPIMLVAGGQPNPLYGAES